MESINKVVIIAVILLFVLFNFTCFVNAQTEYNGEKEKLLQRLLDGNNRFVTGHYNVKNYVEERAELVHGQHPYAIILSCSDSRVPPEIIFDESIGKLFIIRVAGNIIDSVTLGSIEYAAEHLHTRLLVILGHESCGAMKTAIEGGEVTPSIAQIINRIKPAVFKAKSQTIEKSSVLTYATEENIKNQITACLLNSSVIKHLVETKEFIIVGALYSLESGAVKILDTNQ